MCGIASEVRPHVLFETTFLTPNTCTRMRVKPVLLRQRLIIFTSSRHLGLQRTIFDRGSVELGLAVFEPQPQVFNQPLQARYSLPQSRVLRLDFAEELLQPIDLLLKLMVLL